MVFIKFSLLFFFFLSFLSFFFIDFLLIFFFLLLLRCVTISNKNTTFVTLTIFVIESVLLKVSNHQRDTKDNLFFISFLRGGSNFMTRIRFEMIEKRERKGKKRRKEKRRKEKKRKERKENQRKKKLKLKNENRDNRKV